MIYMSLKEDENIKRKFLPEEDYNNLSEKEKKEFLPVLNDVLIQALEFMETKRLELLEKSRNVYWDNLSENNINIFPYLENSIIKKAKEVSEKDLPF